MTTAARQSLLDRIFLIAAQLVPILYFGAQLAAWPFFPGYSLSHDAASLLGTANSLHPWIFNLGAILTGVAALLGALGLFRAFRSETNLLTAGLIGFAVFVTGVMALKAGLFPMPDPRHGSWAFLSFLTIASPLLFLIGLWRRQGSTAVRIYLAASMLLIFLLLPFLMGRLTSEMLQNGTLQRLLAFASFVPVGVVAYHLANTAGKKT